MTETRTLEEFRAKFRVEELKLLENRSWTWSVRPGQPTLGAGILSLNRYAGKFSDVTAEEMQDLADLVGNFAPGKEADFVVLDKACTPLMDFRMQQCKDLFEQLFVFSMLGDDRAVQATYAAGRKVHQR